MGSKPSDERVYVHKGVISRISGGSVIVSLDKNLQCESCHARGACGVSDSVAKEIEVVDSGGHFTLHEPVEVTLKKQSGHMAVFWAYVLPFVLMLLTLLTSSLLFSEWMAGLLSLGVLIPYYLLIHGLKNYFRKTLDISIQRI
jgi:sigma-E factor negative regulatory protein RseC